MKICGIICELNPPHLGHEYLVSKVREHTNCDYIIAIMSGNFVQRGEPAIYEYRTRAEMAINIGFDAVIYMPTLYTLSSADKFARYGVQMAHLLKLDYLAFGALLDEKDFNYILNLKEETKFTNLLKAYLNSGISYSEAYGKTIFDFTSKYLTPNDILALQYINSISLLKTNIKPIIIKRELDISATILRNLLKQENYQAIESKINNKILKIVKSHKIFNYVKFYNILYANIITHTLEDLSTIRDIREGLEYKIYNNNENNFISFNKKIKTKRYNQTYLNRLYHNILFNVKNNFNEELPYIKLVACKNNDIIKILSERTQIPLITNLKAKNTLVNKSLYDYDKISSKIYNICIDFDDYSFPFHKMIKY